MIFSGEQGFALEHFRKDASSAPYVHLNVILLPCEHNFWRPVVSGGNVSRHLRILYASETEVAYLQIAILVDEDVARLEVPVDHPG